MMKKLIIMLSVALLAQSPASAGVLKKTLEHCKKVSKIILVTPAKATGRFARDFAKDPLGHTGHTMKAGVVKTYHGAIKAAQIVEPVAPLVNFGTAVTNGMIAAKAAGAKW